MASIITIAGEKLFAAKAQANEQLDIDTFIFANVPGQDATAPISREEGLPSDYIVHQQIVQQVGRINDNVVVYSTVLDSVTGPFEFNWVGLYSSVNNTLVAINHIPTTPKTVTADGVAGNTLNRNFGIEYSGIADLTGIDVAPETWQLDFTARLQGMDKLTQQLARDLNGTDSFIDDGFKVVERSTLNSFEVTPGVAYIGGLRVEATTVNVINVDIYPVHVYADAYFDGDTTSAWKPRVQCYISRIELDDYIDDLGREHFLVPIAIIDSNNEIQDLRQIFNFKTDIETREFKTLSKAIDRLSALSVSYLSKMAEESATIKTTWHNEQSKEGGAEYLIKDRTLIENDKDYIDGDIEKGNLIGANQQIGNSDFYLILKKNNKLNACCFGALGGRQNDDSRALQKYWEYTLSNDLVFDISIKPIFTISSTYYLSAKNEPTFFSSQGYKNIQIKNGETSIYIVPSNSQGQANLFECKGSDGFMFDTIKFEVDAEKASTGNNVRGLLISYSNVGSKNVFGERIESINGEGIMVTTDLNDYKDNGFDSIYRSKKIKIKNIIIDNSEMPFSYTTEFTGYGVTCQCSGDELTVENLSVENIHRAVFVYGVKGVKVASGKILNSNAATVNIGSYGSCIDIDINLVIEQDHALRTDLTRIQVNELGTEGGASLDILGGRTHTCSGINLDFSISGSASINDSGFSINKTTGNGADSSIEFRDINLKIRNLLSGVSRSFLIFNLMRTQNAANVKLRGLRVKDSVVIENGEVCIPSDTLGNVLFENLICYGNVYCTYGDLSKNKPNGGSIVFNESSINGRISTGGYYDCPVTLRNTEISKEISSDNIVPAQNKTFINSQIGGRLMNKKPWNIYTPIDNSKAMYRPDYPIDNLVMGGQRTSESNLTPFELTLTAPDHVKDANIANFFIESFIGNETYSTIKSYQVSITAKRQGSSGFGIVKGFLTVSGVSSNSLLGASFNLAIFSVINTGGQEFNSSDFTMTVYNKNTVKLICTKDCASLYLSVQEL